MPSLEIALWRSLHSRTPMPKTPFQMTCTMWASWQWFIAWPATEEGTTLRLIVQGLDRVRVDSYTQTEPYMRATFERVAESAAEGVELEALTRSLKDLFRRMAELTAHFTDETVEAVLETEDPTRLAYQVAANTRMTLEARQAFLRAG